MKLLLNNCGILIAFYLAFATSCHTKKPISKNDLKKLPNQTKTFKVNENERGVHFKRFGGGVDTSKVYLPGKYKFPSYDRFIVYNLDLHSENNLIKATTQDKVAFDVSVEYTFKLIPEKVALLHRYIGLDFHTFGVEPKLIPVIQEYFNHLMLEEISLDDKVKFEAAILKLATKPVNKNFLDLESFKIIEMVFPDK